MSHTTTIDAVVISDKSVLEAAIADLKKEGIRCDILENAKPRAYYASQAGMGQAPLVVKLHDAQYDVGLYDREDGKGYEARTDFWGGSVAKVLGVAQAEGETKEQAGLGKLFNRYAVAAATRQAIRQGYQVRRINKDDGSVQLRVAV